MYKIGIDIGGTKVNIGLLNESNEVVCKKKLFISNPKELLNEIKLCLDDILAQQEIKYSDILSCGMGVPGTVSKDGKTAIKVPNLSLENIKLADLFENMTGISTMLIQDSRAAAWGEYLAGNGKGYNTIVCITLGTGIGTGIVIDGKIYNGSLGSAGEVGHIPVIENGRQCGCGKYGCLETYAAGKGLDLTAKELFGNEYTAVYLFQKASEGNKEAIEKINEAVEFLGKAMVSIVNLLSPDCLLFSGGMSKQTDLFVKPLIQYIKSHCYSTRDSNLNNSAELFIDLAKLGEDAPMVGAALLPQNLKKRTPYFSASIMCADMLHLGEELKRIENAGIHYIHCDIMDGHFVPNLMLAMEMLNKIRIGTTLPFDIHIMAENPEKIIDKLDIRKGDIIAVHYESTPHVQRALALIKEKGAMAAIAINPSTPIESVREVLDDIGMILIMSVNPGFSAQKVIPQSFDKISRMRKYLHDLNYTNILIEVDGNCSFENVPKMFKAGADIFVLGTSSLFNAKLGMAEATKELYRRIEERV